MLGSETAAIAMKRLSAVKPTSTGVEGRASIARRLITVMSTMDSQLKRFPSIRLRPLLSWSSVELARMVLITCVCRLY